MNTLVPSCEDVVRLLSSNWIIKGELQHTAFMLNPGETYLSVNRPAIESFCKDVAAFLSKHSDYCVRFQLLALSTVEQREINDED